MLKLNKPVYLPRSESVRPFSSWYWFRFSLHYHVKIC